MYLRIAPGLALLLAVAAPAVAQEKQESALKPAMTFSGTHSAIRKEHSAVITDAAKWKELWKQHRGEADPPLSFQPREMPFKSARTLFVSADLSRAVPAPAPPWTTGAESGSDGKRPNA